jgi:uncharacterized membrane protein
MSCRLDGRLATAAHARPRHRRSEALPSAYHRLYWLWFGFPAFFAVLAIFWLMIAKPPLVFEREQCVALSRRW